MTRKSDLHQVTAWLSDLANLTAGTMPLADSKTKIAAMALVLADDFPPAAFCRQSLVDVAAASRFFPPYADVLKHLSVWWREHRPAQPELAAPSADHYERHNIPRPRDPPTEAEKAAVAEIVRNFQMQTADAKSQALPVATPAPMVAAVMSDRQLLAMHEAAGNAIRVAALRAKIEAADKIIPFPAA